MIFFCQMKHGMQGAPEKFGGWGIPVKLDARLLATQYGECLLRTLQEQERAWKSKESNEKGPCKEKVHIQECSLLATFLSCTDSVIISRISLHTWVLFGSFLKDLWVQVVLSAWGPRGATASGPTGWQSLESSVTPALQPSCHPQPLSFPGSSCGKWKAPFL